MMMIRMMNHLTDEPGNIINLIVVQMTRLVGDH